MFLASHGCMDVKTRSKSKLTTLPVLAGQAKIASQGGLQSQSQSRRSSIVQAGLGDRAARVMKGYTFFYGDSAGRLLHRAAIATQ